MTTDTNGTRRKMFPLDMNGVEVRTLEELRDNFDVESVIGHFKAGELRHRENIARLKAGRENRF